jgi:hypothetical protein
MDVETTDRTANPKTGFFYLLKAQVLFHKKGRDL